MNLFKLIIFIITIKKKVIYLDKINVLIIGNGHYSTGSTVLEGKKETNTDFGVVLPAILELKKQGYVDKVYLAAKNGFKYNNLGDKIKLLNEKFGWDTSIEFFPNKNEIDEKAYLAALKSLPKPGAVIIATPNHLHKEMMLKTIEAGHHFLIVKPPLTCLKDYKEVVDQLNQTTILGMVDYHKIHDEPNLILREQCSQKEYGRIQHIFSKMTQKRDMLEIFGEWFGKETNVNHYIGSHYIHLTEFITGAVPIEVRSTCQYGLIEEEYGIKTPDLIETQILWEKEGYNFSSYHIAGLSDPSGTSAMTHQEIQIIGTNGHVRSDQKNRGFERVLSSKCPESINPNFFYINKDIDGRVNLEGKYGFKSIKIFIKSVLEIENGADIDKFEKILPTLRNSKNIIAILNAADISISKGSSIVKLNDMEYY
jgi:predicted dehydrogenase